MKRLAGLVLLIGIVVGLSSILAAGDASTDYRLLATNKISTMERELNEAARDGFVLVEAMGGKTEHGGSELVAIVERGSSVGRAEPHEYLILATSRTGTMRRELNDAARRGFAFVAQTVYETEYGGEEVVVIMERSFDATAPACEYELLATSRTSTMQKELAEYGRKGFFVSGLSVSKTAFGGEEVIVVVERCVEP